MAAVAMTVAMVVAGCAADGGEAATTTERTSCSYSSEVPRQRMDSPWGSVEVEEGYEAVAGEEIWTLVRGEHDPLYVVGVRPEGAEAVVEALEAETGKPFVEACSPETAAWISTPVVADTSVSVIGVISYTDNETLVVAATQPDGTGTGVRSGVSNIIASYRR